MEGSECGGNWGKKGNLLLIFGAIFGVRCVTYHNSHDKGCFK